MVLVMFDRNTNTLPVPDATLESSVHVFPFGSALNVPVAVVELTAHTQNAVSPASIVEAICVIAQVVLLTVLVPVCCAVCVSTATS